jgi:acyl-CoA thioester hydrolase
MLQREIENVFLDFSPEKGGCAEIEIVVRYAETDQMGVAYHGHYFTWYHIVRDELITRAGIDIKYWERNGVFSPVVEANCIYKFPALYNDRLLVQCRTGAGEKTRIVMYYRLIRKKDGREIALGKTVNVLMKKNGGILLDFPDAMKPFADVLLGAGSVQ